MVYFHPVRRADGKPDIALLRKIQAELESSVFDLRRRTMIYRAINIVQHTPFTLLTTRAKVQKRLDHTVEKVMEHDLRPSSESK